MKAAQLNAECHCVLYEGGGLFAREPVFVDAADEREIREAVGALHRWMLERADPPPTTPGAFMAYDFHLTADGPRLIEINTNAGGGLLHVERHGGPLDAMVEMLFREYGGRPPRVAIVDEQPERQALHAEFLLAARLLGERGVQATIQDVGALDPATVDLVYNRSTDFDLRGAPRLRAAWEAGQVLVTPSPAHHRTHADKRNLVGVDLPWVPETREVDGSLWEDRKRWYFKPASGHGSKGVLRGAKLTRGRWEEVLRGDYMAQREVPPPWRHLLTDGEGSRCGPGQTQRMRFDLRAFSYDGQVLMLAARVYRGQTTNLSTPGGGLAPVIVLPG